MKTAANIVHEGLRVVLRHMPRHQMQSRDRMGAGVLTANRNYPLTGGRGSAQPFGRRRDRSKPVDSEGLNHRARLVDG